MFSTSVSLVTLAAWSLWTAAFGLAVADLFVSTDDLGHFGMIAAAGGGTLHIIRAIRQLGDREVAAFEIGRNERRLR